MISKKSIFIILFFILFFTNLCKPQNPIESIKNKYKEIVSESGDLTDKKIRNYINTVIEIRKFGIDIPRKFAENEGDADLPIEIFNQINNIITSNGFTDFPDFLRVNAKIAWAWNISQGEFALENFQGLTDSSVEQLDSIINDPDIPDDIKEELIISKKELLENWENNKKYAEITLEFIRPLTNEKDLEIIRKYQKELMEAYSGVKVEKLHAIPQNLFLGEEND